MAEPASRDRRPAYGLLLALAALYLTAELRLNPTNRFFDYDEAIYVSQYSPVAEPAHWGAQRARGTAWLVAPLSASGASLSRIRLDLMLLSAGLLLVGFSLWVPLLGPPAVLAALLYGGTWLALFYGAEVMPNHFTALFALIVAAAYAHRRSGGGAFWSGLAALAMAATALMRPTDASCIFAGLVVVELLLHNKHSWRLLLPLALGLAVGWGQWMWEAERRFGGIQARWDVATAIHGGLGVNILEHLRAADGPLLGGDRLLSAGPVLWWAGLVALCVCGITLASSRRVLVLLGLGAGLASTIPYFFLTRSTQLGTLAPVISPRFLCPAYALLAIPAAIGCAELVNDAKRRSRTFGRVIAAGLAVLVALWLGWQWRVASGIAAQQFDLRDRTRVIAQSIRRLRQDRPCLLISQFPEPQIQFFSGCREVQRKPYVLRQPHGLADLKRSGEQRFVLVHPPPYPDEALAMRDWPVVRQPGAPGVLLFVEPESAITDAPARSSSLAAPSRRVRHLPLRTADR